jgi:hypothetical protein
MSTSASASALFVATVISSCRLPRICCSCEYSHSRVSVATWRRDRPSRRVCARGASVAGSCCQATCEVLRWRHTNTFRHHASTAQHSTSQLSTAQHSTAQHSTAQHSTAQHSTAQHSTRTTHTTHTPHGTRTTHMRHVTCSTQHSTARARRAPGRSCCAPCAACRPPRQ